MLQNSRGKSFGVMRWAGDVIEMRRGLPPARRLRGAVALAALVLPQAAWGQAAATLPEVTVTGAVHPPRRHDGRPALRHPPPRMRPGRCPRRCANCPHCGGLPHAGDRIGFDRNKVPAMVQTLTADDFTRTDSPNVVDALVQRIPGIVSSDAQGNSFAPDLRYRGFIASPVQGTPQGLAVYMNGVRVNEAFGDTVNWDLIPTIAIGRADVWTNNPAFGLNALGGAVSFQMKNGFTYQGIEVDTRAGPTAASAARSNTACSKGGMGALSRRPGAQGRRLALPVTVAARPFLRRSRLEGQRRRGASRDPASPTISSAWSGRRRSN